MSYTLYPNSLDSHVSIPQAQDNLTPIDAIVVNRLRDAILAIESELGTSPSGIFGNLKDRLNAFDSRINTINADVEEVALSSPWTEDSGKVYTTIDTNQVIIGDITPVASEIFRVVGDTRFEGDVFIKDILTVGPNSDVSYLQLGPLDLNNTNAALGSAGAFLNYSRGIGQAGIDDLVMSGGINFTPGGSTYNTNLPAIAWQFENFFLESTGPDVRKVECHFGEYRPINWPIVTTTRRWLSCQINIDTHAIDGGVSGQWNWENSARTIQTGRMTETGQLQFREALYCTLGGDKSLFLVEKNTPGNTWAPISLLSTDKISIKMGDSTSGDGDIRCGTTFDLKVLVGSNTRGLIQFGAGVLNFFNSESDIAGINFNVPTSGSGWSVYLGGTQALQVAFDGIYVLHSLKLARPQTPTALSTGNNNNLSLTNTTQILRLASATGGILTGLTGGQDGRVVIIRNIDSADSIQINTEDANSTITNRFAFSANITLAPNEAITVTYDGSFGATTAGRWMVASI